MANIRVKKRVRIEWEPGEGQTPVVFHATPESVVTDRVLFEHVIGTGERTPSKDIQLNVEAAIAHVFEWENVDGEDGQPAPCDEETRRLFFGQQVAAAVAVTKGLFAGNERPNLSGAGPDSSSAPDGESTAEDTSREEMTAAST